MRNLKFVFFFSVLLSALGAEAQQVRQPAVPNHPDKDPAQLNVEAAETFSKYVYRYETALAEQEIPSALDISDKLEELMENEIAQAKQEVLTEPGRQRLQAMESLLEKFKKRDSGGPLLPSLETAEEFEKVIQAGLLQLKPARP